MPTRARLGTAIAISALTAVVVFAAIHNPPHHAAIKVRTVPTPTTIPTTPDTTLQANADAWYAAAAQQQLARFYTAVIAQQQAATTTTTTPRRHTPSPPASGSTSQAAGSSTGHACGGDLPPCCVMNRESGGNPTAYNSSSGAAGKWQAIPSSWNHFGGYASAAQAPESVQDQWARQVYNHGAGASNWAGPGC